jgi:hypothetical protein
MTDSEVEAFVDKPYDALANAKEWFVVVANGPFGFRFGPYHDPKVVGQIMSRAVEEKIAITIIANCGPEFDWELAADMATIKEPDSSKKEQE